MYLCKISKEVKLYNGVYIIITFQQCNMMVYVGMLYFPNVSLPQMPSQTRAHDGAGTSHGGEDAPNLPPVPPTLAEAIAALVNATTDNTRFLCEMAGNQFQQHGGRAPP
jgi:hypothetical protein